MAVTNKDQVVRMTAAADALTGKIELQTIQLEHTAAANAIIHDTAGNVIATLRTTASVLRDWVEFPKGLIVQGLIAQTLTAGALTFYRV